jgi:putative transposase
MMTQVLRVECMEVSYCSALSKLCHQVKNLYNRANFLMNTSLKNTQNLLYYTDLDKLLKAEECYKKLPVHTAQHTLKLLCRNWKSYFQAKKEWKKHSADFFAVPQPPGYKAKDGEVVAILSNQQVNLKNGWLIFPKKVGYYYKTRLPPTTKLREVRIIPRRVGYTLEVIYLKTLPKLEQQRTRKGAVDLGIINLVTFVDNLGNRPIVIKDHGKGLKSITQYYLKKQTQLREQYVLQQKQHFKGNNKLQYGKSFYKLREKWRKKLKDSLHKLTHYLITVWEKRGIQEVVIGYNEQWKQGVHFWKKTTQMFVTLPFLQLIHMLKYKGVEHGIKVETIPEQYTSKCSFLDNEFPQAQSQYLGKRITRRLFRSAHGHLINADVNAAYNILVKSDPKAVPHRTANGVGGYVVYPLRVNIENLKSSLC